MKTFQKSPSSPVQYGARNALPEPLYAQLVTDLISFPVVFVGTELRESPLWTYIALRGSKGSRGIDERRPRSFLVSPNLPPERAELLASFNIKWLEMGADDFAQSVLAELTEEKTRGLAIIRDRAGTEKQRVRFESVIELAALPAEPVSEYLIGARPAWGDITSGRAVQREFASQLELDLLPRCCIITGTAGAGTSTTLMQIALRAATNGKNALWLTSRFCSGHDVSRTLARMDDEAIVFIDDADTLGRSLEGLIKNAASQPNFTLVLGLRSGRLDDVLGAWRPEGRAATEIVVPGLEDSDVDRLLDALDRDNKLGDLKGMPRERQRSVLTRESRRQLLVAMIKATSGRELEEKVADEMNSLKEPQQRIYAVLAIASVFRYRLSRDEVLGASDALNNEGVHGLDRLVALRLLIQTGESYELRHRVIAELAAMELRVTRRSFTPYLGLARILAAKHRPGDRTSRVGRLLITLINHRRISNFFDEHEARRFYQELEEFMADDYHFLLQRGSYELAYGSINLATNYLQQARRLGGGDHRVETEWALLLMRKACSGREEDPVELVEEARGILLDQIERLGASDRHAFHVYGSQMLAWTRRGGLTPEDSKKELARALELVESGASRHPGDDDLRTLAERLKREYLMTAVSKDATAS
jgi:hypothetical protein